jgi:hypothetical protein
MKGYGPSGSKLRNGGEKPHTGVRLTDKGCEVLRKEARPPALTSPMKRGTRSTGKR